MPPSVHERVRQRVAEVADLVTVALDELLPRVEGPESRLTEAMRYAALGPGKRLRPFFALEASRFFEVDERAVLRAACALECVHAYSLVHDDLPCMDDDDMRRGRPTLHRAYDEATAVLAGDALQTAAFDILLDPETHDDAEIRCELAARLSLSSGARGIAMRGASSETRSASGRPKSRSPLTPAAPPRLRSDRRRARRTRGAPPRSAAGWRRRGRSESCAFGDNLP